MVGREGRGAGWARRAAAARRADCAADPYPLPIGSISPAPTYPTDPFPLFARAARADCAAHPGCVPRPRRRRAEPLRNFPPGPAAGPSSEEPAEERRGEPRRKLA